MLVQNLLIVHSHELSKLYLVKFLINFIIQTNYIANNLSSFYCSYDRTRIYFVDRQSPQKLCRILSLPTTIFSKMRFDVSAHEDSLYIIICLSVAHEYC